MCPGCRKRQTFFVDAHKSTATAAMPVNLKSEINLQSAL